MPRVCGNLSAGFLTDPRSYSSNAVERSSLHPMTITPHLFEAYLKCPTKCWLRFVDENPLGNAYAEWVQGQNESYRADAVERLIANAPADECAVAPNAGELKTAEWR